METAHRRKAAMAMDTLPRYAGGGLIDGFKRVIGIAPESPELKAYKERAAAERAAKQNPAPTPEATPKPAISDYVGNSALDKRMKAADAMASGGPVTGPGTGTSDEVPILASNGEYVIRAAAVEEIGTDVLDAINAIGEDEDEEDETGENEMGAEASEVAPKKYAVGGLVQEDSKKPMDATAIADRQMASNAFSKMKDVSETAGRAIADVATIVPRGVVGAYDSTVVRPMRAMGVNAAYLSPALTPDGASVDSPTPFSDIKRARTAQQAMATPAPASTPAMPASSAGAGRGMVNPPSVSPARESTFSPVLASTQPAAPTNSFGDAASWNSNRTPMSAQDKMAMDGIQQRQDLRDSNGLSRMQYDSEVAGANAVNEWQANRGKSTARLAMEGKLAQDVRGDATARYQTDVNAGTSRYATDMQRENNRGQLGISQGRLSNETTTSGVDVAGKQQILDAQRALITAKTPEERKSATEILASLQGRATVPQADEYAYAPGGQEVDPVSSQLVTRPGVIFNKRTGAVGSPQQAGGSISTDPRAIAIRDNKQLSREQKLAELKKIGYQ